MPTSKTFSKVKGFSPRIRCCLPTRDRRPRSTNSRRAPRHSTMLSLVLSKSLEELGFSPERKEKFGLIALVQTKIIGFLPLINEDFCDTKYLSIVHVSISHIRIKINNQKHVLLTGYHFICIPYYEILYLVILFFFYEFNIDFFFLK